MPPDILLACDHLLAAALSGVAAGVLLVLIAGCALRLLGKTNAATRHALWFGTLLWVAAVIPAQLCRTSHVPPLEAPPAAAASIVEEGTAALASALRHHPDRAAVLADFERYMQVAKASAPNLAARMEGLEAGIRALLDTPSA